MKFFFFSVFILLFFNLYSQEKQSNILWVCLDDNVCVLNNDYGHIENFSVYLNNYKKLDKGYVVSIKIVVYSKLEIESIYIIKKTNINNLNSKPELRFYRFDDNIMLNNIIIEDVVENKNEYLYSVERINDKGGLYTPPIFIGENYPNYVNREKYEKIVHNF